MNSQRGASVLEVIFAIAVVLAITPFMFNQISEMSQTVRDVSAAKEITDVRNDILNYIRQNQETWTEQNNLIPDNVLENLPTKTAPRAGIVYKENIQGATATEAYLVFNIGDSRYRVSNIAKYIGPDAAVVQDDGTAYSEIWAAQGGDGFTLNPGELVFRIARDFEGENRNTYLHRGTDANDLNKMQRPLYLKNDGVGLVNINNINSDEQNAFGSLASTTAETTSVNIGGHFTGENVTFYKGATIDGDLVEFTTLNNMGGNGDNILRVLNIRGFSEININSKADQALNAGTVEASTVKAVNSLFHVYQNLRISKIGTSTFSGFNNISVSGSIFTRDIVVDLLQLSRGAELKISRTADDNGNFTSTPLVLGDPRNDTSWVWPQDPAPTFLQLDLIAGSATTKPGIELSGYYIVKKLNLPDTHYWDFMDCVHRPGIPSGSKCCNANFRAILQQAGGAYADLGARCTN